MKKWQKIMLCLLLVIGAFLLTGCGHNIASQSKGIGIDVSWNGSNYVPNVRLGYWDDTTAVVRGNAAVSASTATGGGALAGEGGTSQTIEIATGTQVNEGYIKDILTDPNLDTDAKIAFIKAIAKLEHPSTNGAHNKVSAAESNIIKAPIDEEAAKAEEEQKQAKEAEEAIDELVQKLEAMERAKSQAVSETKEAVNKASTGTASTLQVETKADTAPRAVPAAEQK